MRRRLWHAAAFLHRCRSGPRFDFSLHGQEAQLKTVGPVRLLSGALVLLLHLGFLWVLQGLHTPTPKLQAPSPRLAPTVLVLLPPLQTQSKTPPLPEKKRPLEPARAGDSVTSATAPPPAAEPVTAVTKPTAPASPVAQITPASPAPQAPSAAPIAPAAPEPPKPLNLTLSREAMRALPPASAPLLPSARLPLTAEQRIGKILAANGSGPWVEERLDAEHVRFRSGDQCITYTRPLAASLFPFDASAQRTPWTTTGMQACPN